MLLLSFVYPSYQKRIEFSKTELLASKSIQSITSKNLNPEYLFICN